MHIMLIILYMLQKTDVLRGEIYLSSENMLLSC